MNTLEYICEIYRTKVAFVSDCSYTELNEYLKTTYGVAELVAEYNEAGFTIIIDYVVDNENQKVFLVWSEKHDDMYTIMHEVVHLIKKIFEYTGAKFEDDETIARYQEFWVRKFTGAPINKKHKPCKVKVKKQSKSKKTRRK
jgi:hypothetical protein